MQYHKLYEKSISLLKNVVAGPEYNSIGFFAASVDKENYKRVFARDAFWIGMAALVSGDMYLIQGFRDSLRTLAENQREDGAVPSNVSVEGKVSYGIISPRVDPTTLYIIGCSQFYKWIRDKSFLKKHIDSVKQAMKFLEDTWENKTMNLLYIPRAGNWADEYIQQGFVLYDEVLWSFALDEYAYLMELAGDKSSAIYREKAEKIRRTLRDDFWIKNIDVDSVEYYRQIRQRFNFNQVGYFIHYYYVTDKEDTCMGHGQGIFDAFGNILALLTRVSNYTQSFQIIRFIDEMSINKYPLVPAHYPFFSEDIFKSQKLHQYRFKEFVGHYHNGGLWCWYTGLYVVFLEKLGHHDKAMKFLDGIAKANEEKKQGLDHYEYHSGKRSEIALTVTRKEGVDLSLSLDLKETAQESKSTVQFRRERKKAYVSDDLAIRALAIKNGETVKAIAIGPDSDIVLEKIKKLEDNSGRCFEGKNVIVKSSRPGGIPNLGVSAAAYVLGYKAVFHKRYIFV